VHRLLPGLLRFVRIQRVRRAQDFLQIGFVYLMGEDGRPFGDEPAQAARVIDVAVRVDQVFDRLPGNQALGFRDDGQRAGLVLPALDDRDVVLEIDRDHGVAAGDQVDAVAQLLRLRGRVGRRRGRGGRAAPPLLRLDVDGRVHLHIGDVQIEDRKPTLFLDDVHRELRTAGVLVVAVARLEAHVADELVVYPRLDALDHVLRVDVAV